MCAWPTRNKPLRLVVLFLPVLVVLFLRPAPKHKLRTASLISLLAGWHRAPSAARVNAGRTQLQLPHHSHARHGWQVARASHPASARASQS